MELLWIVIGVLVIFGMIWLKFEHNTKYIKIGVLLAVILLLYFSMNSIFNSDQVDLSTPRGIVNGVYLYVGWLGQTLTSLWDVGQDTVTVIGNVVKVNSTEVDNYRRN